jgi:hypothetical protein
MQRILLLSAICAFIGGVPAIAQTTQPATAPATQELTLDQLREEERRTVEQRLKDLPAAGPYSREQAIALAQEDRRLVARTQIPPTEGNRRLTISDDPHGLWHATVYGDPNARETNGFFLVERYDFSDPSIVFSLAAITANPQQINITGNWERPDGMLQLDLIDRFGSVDDEGGIDTGGVRLIVSGFGLDGDRTVNVRLESRDLTTLRRQHPRLVNTYLRPVLRQLGQEQLLAIDERLAWQVLGGEQPVDPKAQQRVNELLPALDADAFAERQAAVEALKQLGSEGALVLMKLDRATLSPEQRAQIDQVLAHYKQASARDVSALADDLDFLLDVLLTDNADLRALALARLKQKTDQPIDFDPAADPATRTQRVIELRAALLPPPATQATDAK